MDRLSLQVELATQATRLLVGAGSMRLKFQVVVRARFYGENFELSNGRRTFSARTRQEARHADRSQLYAELLPSSSPLLCFESDGCRIDSCFVDSISYSPLFPAQVLNFQKPLDSRTHSSQRNPDPRPCFHQLRCA